MGLKIFNTLSRTVEEFQSLNPGGEVRMYCCGPTVHNFAHIGNFRTFVFSDLVRRYLEFRGYKPRHVMNVTDVEDKIIKGVRASGKSLAEFTQEYEKAFFQDLETLLCVKPHDTPRATAFIPEIIDLIEKLVARGIAYQASDKSVYFSISKYTGCGCKYGQLAQLNFEEMRVGERVASDEYEKESLADFALWKARVPEDGDVFWPSPFGEGRPGWHIECSAMSMKLLGTSFDLHLGGEDLVFPHHEDEIAQSEGAGVQEAGQRFVKYWMHGAHLLVEGKKMAKSLGNYFTIRDLLQKGYSGREIRYLLISAHYRESFNFTLDGLTAARAALARIDEYLLKVQELAGGATGTAASGLLENFTAAMDQDLNVSKAWGAIFETVREHNRLIHEGKFSGSDAAAALAAWQRLDTVLGLGMPKAETNAPAECESLLQARNEARKAKDFAKADGLRNQLKQMGWIIEDTPKGSRLKRG
jgi:cysteinyl-tRNA synthetase